MRIFSLSKEIITDFTHYVQEEVHKGRNEYIETGINDDLFVYREFFLNILGLSLGLEDKEPKVHQQVKEELTSLIKRDLSYRRYVGLNENRVLIYNTCRKIFDGVVRRILEGGDLH